MTTNYNEKYKKYLDKAFTSYGITPADINLPQFDTKKQYNKDDYKLLKDQIQGWEFYHPLKDIGTSQLDFEYKRLRDSGELKDALPKQLLKEYQTRKRFRGVNQETQKDYTAHGMVIKNYRDEIERRAALKAKGLRPTISIPGGRRKTKRRRKKKRKTKKTRKKRRRRTRKKRRTKRRRKR